MCLGIPGKVISTYREHDVLMGKVDFTGITKRVCLEHVPEVLPGQYVLVHVGFALSMIDEAEAKQVFEFLGKMQQLEEIREGIPTEGDLGRHHKEAKPQAAVPAAPAAPGAGGRG